MLTEQIFPEGFLDLIVLLPLLFHPSIGTAIIPLEILQSLRHFFFFLLILLYFLAVLFQLTRRLFNKRILINIIQSIIYADVLMNNFADFL